MQVVCVCVCVCVGFQSDVSGCGGFSTCVLCVYVCARVRTQGSSLMWVSVGVRVSPWRVVDLYHQWLAYSITLKIISMIQPVIFGRLLFLIVSDSGVYVSLYVYEEICFSSLLQARQPPHLTPYVPGIFQDSVLGCTFKVSCDKGRVLRFSALRSVFLCERDSSFLASGILTSCSC